MRTQEELPSPTVRHHGERFVFPHNRWLICVLACLALVSAATPLLGEDEPYFGLWDRTPRSSLDRGQFLYQMVLRYRARSSLRTAGLLPDAFRAPEDSLGMRSDRFEEFVVLQDSLGQGWLPPRWARLRGREIITRRDLCADRLGAGDRSL